MVIPYATFILPQAIYYENPRLGFIAFLVLLALAGAGLIEGMFLLLRPPYRSSRDRALVNSSYPNIVKVAKMVAITSILADVGGAVLGGGTIETQLTGQAASSPIVAVTTLFACWKFLAVALFASARLGNFINTRTFYRWAGLLAGTQVLVASYTAITQPLISFMIFVGLAGLILGLVRTRILLVASIVLLLIWPTIYSVRNDIRRNAGVWVAADVDAQDRLRVDQQVAKAANFKVPAPLAGVPGPVEVVRYGLIPRLLDRGRPVLVTGYLINEYMGGSRTSAYTFLPLGTIYFLGGPLGVVVFYACAALCLIFLLRTRGGPGTISLMILCLIITGPLGWTTTYPDSLIGLLQSLVAMVPVVIALRVVGKDQPKKRSGDRTVMMFRQRRSPAEPVGAVGVDAGLGVGAVQHQ